MLILILTLVFLTCNPKLIFGQIWVEKVNIITFMITFTILFFSNHLRSFNLGHCVPYVVFMFREPVIL